jgi:hypothetical protein
MFKRYFFLIIAAIVVLIGASSCDKDFLTDQDRFIKTDLKYFKFVAQNTIAIYELGEMGNFYEVDRHEVNFMLIPSLLPNNNKGIKEELAFAENETGKREISLRKMYDAEFAEYEDEESFTSTNNNFEVTIRFNLFEQGIRITGYNLNQDSCILYPLDDFVLTTELHTLKKVDVPFYQKVQITYKLVTDDDVLVTSTSQELNLGTKPEDEDSSTPSDETNNNGGESEGEGANV